MKELSPDEEAAMRLGDNSHKRAFLEEVSVRLYEVWYKGNYKIGTDPPSTEHAVEHAHRMWEAIEKKLAKP